MILAPGGADPDGWRRDLGRLMADELDYAFVLGGDGTALKVATDALGHDVRPAIIPLGTANLLARDLGLPLALSLIAGTWTSEPRVFSRTAHRVTIDTRKWRRINALNDGEPVRLRTPLHYDILTHALPMLIPGPGPVRTRGQET